MGMDAYMFSAHSKKELQSDDYWAAKINEIIEEENKWSQSNELWYARKFYDLHTFITYHFCPDYECGDFIEISKEDLKKIIEFCCFHRDYFDGFHTVPALCEIYDHWDDLTEHNLKLFYECDW